MEILCRAFHAQGRISFALCYRDRPFRRTIHSEQGGEPSTTIDDGKAYRGTARTSAIIIMLMAMATIFGNVMTLEQVPERIASAILSFTENKIAILLLINLLLLWVGTFMEALAAIVILTPILLPLVLKVGVDPIHFGVIMVVNLAIGFVTPPVGVNLFVASGITKVKIEQVSRAAVPFLIAMLVVLGFVTFVPEISLFLID